MHSSMVPFLNVTREGNRQAPVLNLRFLSEHADIVWMACRQPAVCQTVCIRLQVLAENSTLHARNQELLQYGQTTNAALLEAAEQENLELQQELQHAQELSSSLAAALKGSQICGTQLQQANGCLLDQLASLGVRQQTGNPSDGIATKVDATSHSSQSRCLQNSISTMYVHCARLSPQWFAYSVVGQKINNLKNHALRGCGIDCVLHAGAFP
jgi:hypothetical protein